MRPSHTELTFTGRMVFPFAEEGVRKELGNRRRQLSYPDAPNSIKLEGDVMHRRDSLFLVPGLVLLAGALSGQSVRPAGSSGIVWHKSYAEALAEAKARGKPLLVEFR